MSRRADDNNPSGESPVDSTVLITEQPVVHHTSGFRDGESQLEYEGKLFVEKYQMLSVIGKGGMGTVYKVRHVLLDKFAALKVLHTEHASSGGVLRFQQEARLVSSLKHPNIVSVTDFGLAPDGQPYMVMDLLEGLPLNAFLKKEQVSVERLAKIFGQVCDALSYAHEKAIVHRDVKPGNIMVHTVDGVDLVTVVDFGIAKILPQEDSSKFHLTKTGDVFGTPLYMSPEQCLGQQVDARADIYALGCVMYEAFAGVHPFATDNIFDLVARQISETPPPFQKNVALNERLFEAIVLKAMAKRAEDRYRFAVEMASDLKTVEVNDAGFIDGMKVRLKVERSRVKAGSRATAWWSIGAVSLSNLALLNILALTMTLESMKHEAKEMERFENVFVTLVSSVTTTDEAGVMRPTPGRLRTNMSAISNLVATDLDEKQAYEELNRVLPIAERTLLKARLRVMRDIFRSDFDKLSRDLEPLMDRVIDSWTNVGLQFSQLRAISYAKVKTHKDKLELYLQVYPLIQAESLLNLLALGALLGVRIRTLLARRRASKQGSFSTTTTTQT